MLLTPPRPPAPATRALSRLASGLQGRRHVALGSRLDRLEGAPVAPEALDAAVSAYYDSVEALSASAATESLVEGFRRLNEADYSVLSLKEKALIWSALCELKTRFPLASGAADAWLGSLNEDDDGEGPEYGRVFLSAAGF